MAWRRVNHPSRDPRDRRDREGPGHQDQQGHPAHQPRHEAAAGRPLGHRRGEVPDRLEAHRPRHQHHRLRRLRGAGAGDRGPGARLRDVLDQEERPSRQDRLHLPGGRGRRARDRRPEAARLARPEADPGQPVGELRGRPIRTAPRSRARSRTSPSSACSSVSTATSTAWCTSRTSTGTGRARRRSRTTTRATSSRRWSPTSTSRRSASRSRSRRSSGDPFAEAVAGVKRGDIVTVTVTSIEDGGIEVEYDGMKTFIRRSDLSRDRSEQRPERFTKGDHVDARVVSDRREDAQARPLDQGARDRRGEGGGGAVRLVRLRRLARRHPRRGAEAQGQRLSAWTRSNATSTRSGAASGAVPPSGAASSSRRCSPCSSRLWLGSGALAPGRAADRALRGQRRHHRRPRARRAARGARRQTTTSGRWSCGSTRRAAPRPGRRRSTPRCARIAAKKPLVAELAEVAASGGYVAAIAADHIVGARQHADRLDRRDHGVSRPDPGDGSRLGIGLETVRSSELKAEPSPFRPTNPAARARRRGAGRRQLPLVPRPRRRAARARGRRARRAWRTAASSPGGSRSRTA